MEARRGQTSPVPTWPVREEEAIPPTTRLNTCLQFESALRKKKTILEEFPVV